MGPFFLYAFAKAATTRTTLTEDGLRARPKRFGWDRFRIGTPPLLPWSNVTAVKPHLAYVGQSPDTRPVLTGVQVVGATRDAYWEIDLTPDMTSWTTAMVFLLEHVGSGAVDPEVWRLLPKGVTLQLGLSVWPRPELESGLRGLVSRLIR